MFWFGFGLAENWVDDLRLLYISTEVGMTKFKSCAS